jgi:hypothetical protein
MMVCDAAFVKLLKVILCFGKQANDKDIIVCPPPSGEPSAGFYVICGHQAAIEENNFRRKPFTLPFDVGLSDVEAWFILAVW